MASGDKQPRGPAQDPLSQLDMYHIELTGVCTDDDRTDFTRMMREFASKFKGLVELAPVTIKKI